jgi:HlyD family secretion protein
MDGTAHDQTFGFDFGFEGKRVNKFKDRRSHWWTILLATASLAVLVGLGLRPARIPVEVATVKPGSVEINIDDDGITRVRERFAIIAPISGKMVRLQVHPGDRVRLNGDPLITLQPTDSDLLDPRTKLESEERVKAAQASILRADQLKSVALETLELSEHEFKRASELIKSNSVSQSEFDTIEHRYRIAKAELRAADFMRSIAEHELGVAQAVLKARESPGGEPMLIGAPIDGVVLRVMREDAGFVVAGTPILELGDPSQMEVLVDVLSTAAVSIKPGAKVEIRGWGGTRTLGGRVRLVEPSAFLKISALGVEERRVNVLIDLDQPWESRKELSDGFRVDASIQIDKSDLNVLTVPTTSLESTQGKWYVYKIIKSSWGGHCVKRTEVDIGLSSRTQTQLRSGLEQGDLVVLYPPESIRDGSWITYEAHMDPG